MADLILVLDGARLLELGAHDELMARGGHSEVNLLRTSASDRFMKLLSGFCRTS